MTTVPALAALLVSIAFTLLAVRYPHAANIIAVPVAAVAIGLMVWQAARDRRASR